MKYFFIKKIFFCISFNKILIPSDYYFFIFEMLTKEYQNKQNYAAHMKNFE